MSMSTSAGIGARGRAELAAVLGSGQRFLRPSDVVGKLGLDPQAAAERLSRWASEGWLRRVRRGLYIPVPVDAANPAVWSEDAYVVADAVWAPCYFTGWSAANHWSLTDQLFRTTVLKTVQRVRQSAVQLLDHDYLVRHVARGTMGWGLKTEWRRDIRLKFADPARTVVDIFDDPRLAGGIRHAAEILTAYLQEHDPSVLIEYGDRLGNRAVFKRLGYVLESLGEHESPLIAGSLKRISAGISPLDPDGPAGGTRVARWRLRANVHIRPDAPA